MHYVIDIEEPGAEKVLRSLEVVGPFVRIGEIDVLVAAENCIIIINIICRNVFFEQISFMKDIIDGTFFYLLMKLMKKPPLQLKDL